MFEIIRAGGWVMWPLILCSIIAMAITIERFWTLRYKRVLPKGLVAQVWQWVKNGEIDKKKLDTLRRNSPLGKILAAGLVNMQHDRDMMKASIEEVANQVVHDLERYLAALGTIAEISPLLGLLGTVTGIISMFEAVGAGGLGNPALLSTGLSEALITTATGLFVAIPTYVFYRYFRARVDSLIIEMEQESIRLIDVLHGEREAQEK